MLQTWMTQDPNVLLFAGRAALLCVAFLAFANDGADGVMNTTGKNRRRQSGAIVEDPDQRQTGIAVDG